MDFLTKAVTMELEREVMVNVIIDSHKNTMDLLKHCDNEFQTLYESLSSDQREIVIKVTQLKNKMVNLNKLLKQQATIIENERVRILAKKIEPVSKKQKR